MLFGYSFSCKLRHRRPTFYPPDRVHPSWLFSTKPSTQHCTEAPLRHDNMDGTVVCSTNIAPSMVPPRETAANHTDL